MSFLFPKPKTPAQTPQSKLANIDVTEAVIGKALPIIMGQRRVSQSLIYYADFTAVPHVQQTSSGGGGKGLGGGGGSTQTQTTYTYTAATMGALCSGPVTGIVNVWDTKGRYQQTSATEAFTVPSGGGAYTVVNHGLFKVDRGVGFAQSYSQTVNDFGSPGSTTLSGSFQVPMTGQPGTTAPGPGQYAYDASTGTYHFHAADVGKAVQINYSYNLLNINNTEDATIPGSPFQILVQDSADFLQDSGVVFYPSGIALTKVTSSPSTGQYTVAAGLYTFAAADTTKQVQISYVTNTANQQSDAQTSLNITLLPGTKGQSVWSYLTSRHPEAAIGYTETAIVASPAMDLGENGEMPNYSFEVAGPYQYGAGIVDCDPADVIGAFLSDPFFGIGFPTSAFGNWIAASNFWVANSFFISPLVDSQTTTASAIGDILESGMTAAFWSEGLLKLVPYGDTSAAGNGQIFVPNTQPIVDLDDDDFIGDGLVKVQRSPWQDADNKVQITWTNRLNGYNSEITTEQDDAAIQRYGLRAEDPQSWDFINTLAAAQFAGNLRVKRSVNIRAQYTFSITSNYSFLEPMDLVTITVPELGWNKLPVRIHRIVDHPDENGLEITAEEFPWGTAQPTLYGKQTGAGFKPGAGQADPGNTTALIFEAPNRLGLQQGNILYGFCNGASPDWGGCQPFVSFDGVTYQPFGSPILKPARLGNLTTAWTFTNLLTNGDGESGTLGSQEPSWTNINAGSGGAGLLAANDFVHSGSFSMKITNAAGNNSANAQTISLTGGLTYVLQGWVRSTALTGGLGFGALLNMGITSGIGSFTTINKGGTYDAGLSLTPTIGLAADNVARGFTFLQCTFMPASSGTVTLLCQNIATNAGSAWFDDVLVAQIDPDPTNFQVAMTSAGSQLPAMSTSDFNQGVSLCAVVDTVHGNSPFELFSYKNSSLVGANTFKLDTFHRGQMGTSITNHSIGETFARLDEASFTYQYDPSYYGTTIFFKFPAFNTLGGRPQPLSQASVYSFTLPGNGPGTIDLNTGLYRPGLGAIPNSWTGAISYSSAVPGTSVTLSWNITVNRAAMPTPSQSSNTLISQTYNSSVTISGLTHSTSYWVYPYLDDTQVGSPLVFVTNAQVSGATGTPAICYTSPTAIATYMQGRNDHLPLTASPMQVTTAPASGSPTGGSGNPVGGACPRGDMLVEHEDKGVMPVSDVRVGDYIRYREEWVRVQDVKHKTRRLWIEVALDCGEDIVVTPNHRWPTVDGERITEQMGLDTVFFTDDGVAVLNHLTRIDQEALCVHLTVDHPDHCYNIGRHRPIVITHNGNQIEIS